MNTTLPISGTAVKASSESPLDNHNGYYPQLLWKTTSVNNKFHNFFKVPNSQSLMSCKPNMKSDKATGLARLRECIRTGDAKGTTNFNERAECNF